MPDLPFPRGVRDLMPNEALFRNELLRKIESVYQRFGFLAIDTPMFESMEVLTAKDAIGEENKLIYELKNEKLGLRYDQTVSLARYYAMHADVPLPFKRYALGKVWRMDEPQRNRYREITQADVDILGGKPVITDAEVIAASAKSLEAVGVEYELHINDREAMDYVLAKLKVPQGKYNQVYHAVDKLDKVGKQEVERALADIKLTDSQIDGIISMLDLDASNDEKVSYLKSAGDREMQALEQLLAALDSYVLHGHVVVDFSVVRGLDYYTSTVFEFRSMREDMPGSICGGGRYDGLIKLYSGKDVPAVGSSIGIDRIMNILAFRDSPKYTYANVIVNYIRDTNYKYALKVATAFREAGINTDINLAQRNIANQLAYANSIKVAYAAIVGDEEQRSSKVKLRDLISGEEETLGIDDAIKRILK